MNKAASLLVVRNGPIETEEALLSHLGRLLDKRQPRAVTERFTTPIRIVVSSGSLRDHLAEVITRHFDRPILSVKIQTHFRLVLEILENAGTPFPQGTQLFHLIAERLASKEDALRSTLENFDEAQASILSTVRDFLDAGLEPEHFEALEEFLTQGGHKVSYRAAQRRVLAIVRTALATDLIFEDLGFSYRAKLIQRATRHLNSHGGSILPTDAIIFHGYAEATGLVSDLIEALMRKFPGTLFLDQPPIPFLKDGVESGFSNRLFQRFARFHQERTLGTLAPKNTSPIPGADGFNNPDSNHPHHRLIEASDQDAEIRHVAIRLRQLLRQGTCAERIAVVARDLAPYVHLLRRHLLDQGVPFSGYAAVGPPSPVRRDHQILIELLADGLELRLERWLDGWLPMQESIEERSLFKTDLRMAFQGRGLFRLADIVNFRLEDTEPDPLPLPVRDGLDSHSAGSSFVAVRKLTQEDFNFALNAARSLAEFLEAQMDPQQFQTFSERCHFLHQITEVFLQWPETMEARESLALGLAALQRDIPADWLLTHQEFTQLIQQSLKEYANVRLGGKGSGVQVLSALEARACTFDHLFLVGVHKGLFPRTIREDPLFPDSLRQAVGHLLPELPIKSTGFDEERYLFAQLLSAAPAVTISWPKKDSSGKRLSTSPLLNRCLDAPLADRRTTATSPWANQLSEAETRQLPVHEQVALRGIHGTRQDWGKILELGMADAYRLLSETPSSNLTPSALARARRAVIEELDPDLSTREGRALAYSLGPFFGFVGPKKDLDPRQGDLYVTTLENLAACPWQTFLQQVLRIHTPPSEFGTLPRLRGALIGQLVHSVLEVIGRRFRAKTSAEVRADWPEESKLDQILEREATRILAQNGLRLDGLAKAAAASARPFLKIARAEDWRSPPRVHAVEREYRTLVRLEHEDRAIRFKVDRVDSDEFGFVRTDYKTGPPIEGSTTEAQHESLLKKVQAGQWLQIAAYIRGDSISSRPSRGRYLFLRPDLPPELRTVEIDRPHQEMQRAFLEVVQKLLMLWDTGEFFPRLLDPKENSEPRRCSTCRVSEACLRRDSGSRLRLKRWHTRTRISKDQQFQVLRAVWDLWGTDS